MDDNTIAHESKSQSIVVQSNSKINDVDCLLIEFLKRLPNTKAAILCKLVCKRWNAIILSSDFIASFIHHRMISKTRKPTFLVQIGSLGRSGLLGNKFIMSFRDDTVSKYPTSKLRQLPGILDGNCKVHVAGSFNDLLLLRRSSNEVGISYCLFNPFTMQWISLPPLPRPYKVSFGIIMEGLLCDPYVISSSIINDCYKYKVVCLFYTELGFIFHEFSSQTNEWFERITHFVRPPFPFKDFANTTYTYNGKIFWLFNPTMIGVYDPDKFEPSYTIKSPGLELGLYVLTACLGVNQGCLRLVQTVQPPFLDWVLKVWELINDSTNEWRLVHEVAPSKLKLFDTGHVLRFNNPNELEALPIHPSDGDIIYFGYNNKAFSCNLKKKEIMAESTYKYFFGVESFAIAAPLWPTPIYPPSL